jgi:monoamine oxidase
MNMGSNSNGSEAAPHVAIVGGGLAGLTAARELVRAGRTVVVLEARDRVGGRTLAQDTALGHRLDTGGQWIGPTQDRMEALVAEFGIKTYPQYCEGIKQLRVCGSYKTYQSSLPALPVLSLLDFQHVLNQINRMAKQVPLDAPYAARKAADWDGMTVETWKRGAVRTKKVRAMLDIAIGAIFAADPQDLSFLHFLFYLQSGGGLEKLAEIQNGAQQTRAHGGFQQVSERMAAELGSRVRLESPVRAIRQTKTGVTITSDSGTIEAQYAVVAVPPTLAGRIAYTPAMPSTRDQLTQRVPMGSVIKCIAIYDEPFWRREGFSGEVVYDEGPITFVFDDTPEGSGKGALIGFIVGSAAREWSERSPENRRAKVLQQFGEFFGPQAADPIEYIDKDWCAEAWSGGCYAGYMAPGVLTSYGKALREPVGRIHWAGTETSDLWNGYMDGAVRSGERVAAELLARMAKDSETGSGVRSGSKK